MARTNRVKASGDAWYHVMSRTNGRRILFGDGRVRSALVDALRRAAAFSGVELRAYVAMGNHFHAVVKVSKPSVPTPAEELLRRVGALKGDRARLALAARWERLASSGAVAALEAEQARLRARMHDVSGFAKTFKEEFDRAFKRGRPYCGSVWSGRFASTLVEGGEHLRRCVRYVLYNPVRAGLVARAADYAWAWCAAGADSCAGACAGTGPAQVCADAVPRPGGAWWLRRVAQVGAGKVFGSAAFVLRTASALGGCFRARSVGAHPVGEIGYSTHGWRLATAGA